MKNDIRSACLALVRSCTSGSIAARRPRPAALGWKLQSGKLPAAELYALYESVHDELAEGDTGEAHRWFASEPLRALMAEYHAVRRGDVRSRRPEPAARCRRVTRPANCA
jgi:hypothetical protein